MLEYLKFFIFNNLYYDSWCTVWEPLTLVAFRFAFKHAFCTLATERVQLSEQVPEIHEVATFIYSKTKRKNPSFYLSFYLFHDLQTKALTFSLIRRISRRERTEKRPSSFKNMESNGAMESTVLDQFIPRRFSFLSFFFSF